MSPTTWSGGPIHDSDDLFRQDTCGQRTGGAQQDLASGQGREQRLRALRIKFRKDVVQQQQWRGTSLLGHQLVDGEPQGEGNAPLLTLGGLSPRRQAVDPQGKVITVRTYKRHAPAKFVPSRCHQGSCEGFLGNSEVTDHSCGCA